MDRISAEISIRVHRLFAALGVMLVIALWWDNVEAAATATPAQTSSLAIGFPEFPPLSFTNVNGEPDGYLVYLSAALFARAGISSHVHIYPAPRLFDNMANGSLDFSMLVHNHVLDACCLFSRQAVVREYLRVYHVNGKSPIHDKNELVGKRIITIQGYSYAGLINFINDPKNRITNEVAPTHEAAFTMLDAGRADYVLDYTGPATSGLTAHPVKNLRFEVIDYLDIYLVLSKAYPDAEHLLARLTTLVKNMQNEPKFRPPDNY
ncbi:MAG TPA: transporter substrate-binding domain-containing protein [Burkholderiaceae bacterium]|jgi:ABC-type amino acid transport substrate-binding protein